MADEFLRVAVHDEFAARIEAEEKRQNARIEKLENVVDTIQELTVSVKTMAANIERLTIRLEDIEAEPGNKWRRLTDGIIGAAAGLIGAGIIYAILMAIK